MSIVNSPHEPRERDDARRKQPLAVGWMLSSNTTPGERCSCDTITRSAPLITKVPSGVRIGSSTEIDFLLDDFLWGASS